MLTFFKCRWGLDTYMFAIYSPMYFSINLKYSRIFKIKD